MEEAVKTEQKKTSRKRKKTKGRFDYTLLIVIMVLIVFGLVMIYSTSYYTASSKYDNPAYWVIRQGMFAAAGFVAMLWISGRDYHVWWRYSWLLFVVVNVMLAYVLFFGRVVNGARRWLYIGPVSIQPSEIAKLALILSYAKLLTVNINKIAKLKYMLTASILMAVPIILVGIENLSTAIILVAIAAIMLYVSAPKKKPLFILAGAALGMLLVFYNLGGKEYRGGRFEIWRDPFANEDGYQTVQSLYAIGSGGLLGKGLGQSLQKLGFVPEAHNDMIFSIICEELGFVGAICVIVLYLLLLVRLYRVVLRVQDLYGALIVIGAMAHIGIQVFVNIAVVTNTIPNTGVPLPFISYGGTSIVFLLCEMGVVMSVARTMQREE